MSLNPFFHSKPIIILIIFMQLIDSIDSSKKSAVYGDFAVGKFEIKVCEKPMKPQKHSNISFVTITGKDGRPILLTNFTVTHDIGPMMAKLNMYKSDDGKLTKIISINQDNVCKYAFPLKLLPFTLKVDNKCVVKPASYINEVIDLQKMMYGFIGKKIFYSTYITKLEWFSTKYMAVCAECVVKLVPKI